MFSRNRTELVVRNMLHAIEAPIYDVGVLSDRGMMPGLDAIPADKVLSRLPLLKQRNATGPTSTSAHPASIATPCSTTSTA